jgi:glycosyltransferase involved in cell wall biosynthesis
MPSQVSEGFPRTIWEAMAHSVPVVTTTVGSIPYILTHEENALFIKPFDSVDTANKIQMLVESSSLCIKIVENGWKMAQESTLENQSEIIYNKILTILD